MNPWPRQRGPILVPVSIIVGTGLVLALLVNGARIRTEQMRERIALSAADPTLTNGLDPDSAAAIGAPTSDIIPPEETTAPTAAGVSPSATRSASTTATLLPLPGGSPTSTNPLVANATAAVKAWQLPTKEARAAALKPLATPQYLALIASADPARIPKSAPTSGQMIVEADDQAQIGVVLEDKTVILVNLMKVTGNWLATDIELGGTT